MTIPEQQLETWCNPGAGATAVATHTSIRHALETANTSLVRGRDIEIFLQGSYRNVTNIRSDSDVDVVVLLRETYTRDTSRLGAFQQQAELTAFLQSPAQYPFGQFRPDVLESLRRYYGAASVTTGNKAIKVQGRDGLLAADVIPALVHKLYTSYGTTILTAGMTKYIEGFSFWDQTGRQIVNYPKEHITNGQSKNGIERTNGNYKPIVRMFKNARRYLVDKGLLGAATAPSYFVECLLYNVPDHLFVANRQNAMRGILEWLQTNNKVLFFCQNGQVLLFVGSTPEHWNLGDADAFIATLIWMWNNWPV